MPTPASRTDLPPAPPSPTAIRPATAAAAASSPLSQPVPSLPGVSSVRSAGQNASLPTPLPIPGAMKTSGVFAPLESMVMRALQLPKPGAAARVARPRPPTHLIDDADFFGGWKNAPVESYTPVVAPSPARSVGMAPKDLDEADFFDWIR